MNYYSLQISGQYLKVDRIYVFVNICACSRSKNFLIRQRAFFLIFALPQIFSMRHLKLIFLSIAIPRSSLVSDNFIVFSNKNHVFHAFLFGMKHKLKC